MPSMKVNKILVPALKKVMLTATAIVALMQCSEEEMVTPAAPVAEIETATSAAAIPLTISSLTVAGINTTFATAKDCKTCTFVIPEGTELVDGKAMGFQPGNIICLNAAFKYGNLEFVNMEGTEENPIVITTVGAAEAVQNEEQGSESNPY
jgi:hypothetical protein